jgi:hypothetical protein
MWLIMRGALRPDARKLHSELLPADDHRHGGRAVRVSYVFDLERSAKGLRFEPISPPV